MTRNRLALPLIAALGVLAGACGARELPLERIALPPGFRIALYSDAVPGARSLALGPRGTVYVGSRGAGKVYALPDRDGDGRADRVLTLAEGLEQPNGVDLRGEDLYIAEHARIIRLPGVTARLEDPPTPEVVSEQLPQDSSHGWRYARFAPDGGLYVGVGAPCNICDPPPGYAAIRRYDVDSGDYTVYARGVRNSVGFDWHPDSGALWFTDNGRDSLGDNIPPDELNRAPRPGLHFGYPYCHGGTLPDPRYGKPGVCADYVPPALALGPHVAALGMRFYTGGQFPADYRGDIFIAEHGSWNRSEKIGYRVMRVRMRDGQAQAAEPFARGWLQNESAWGRPVDVLVMPDGALLVSDDQAGAVYRISYEG